MAEMDSLTHAGVWVFLIVGPDYTGKGQIEESVMKSKVSVLLLALCCLHITATQAEGANVFQDEARVSRVEPILETVNLPHYFLGCALS